MYNIGQRIKELRKSNSLTQEQLAARIGVTYKSVSKWECGLTMPDLSLIVPLSRVLGVTTDELLGASERHARIKALEEEFLDPSIPRYSEETVRICEIAVKEYPDDMKWLNRYAWEIWCRAIQTLPNGEAFEAEREKVIALFDRVIGNTDDDAIKANAIVGITGCLCGKGCKDEARRYVDMYPEVKLDYTEKEELLCCCLDGEEQIKRKQQFLDNELIKFVNMLVFNTALDRKSAVYAADTILNAIIPDGNLCLYHHPMSHIKTAKAEISAKEGDTGLAMVHLNAAVYHAKEYDKIAPPSPKEFKYTAPLLDRVSFKTEKMFYSNDNALFEDIKEMTKRKSFDALRKREDFQKLFSK